ncbi:MAG: DEAD/DEAH box helicase [Bacteroidota bacterium]
MVSGQSISFQAFKLNKQLLKAVEAAGYSAPTPIQVQAIPRILAGYDVIGIAQTGTGKTAAYLLPLLMQLKHAVDAVPKALILAPNKELILQIDEHIAMLAQHTDLRHTGLYGGVGTKQQVATLTQGIDIVVATPGRLLDLYHRGAVHLRGIRYLVLDEADRMLDMGFMPQFRGILEVIPTKRQNLLFSATFPPKVVTLSEEFLAFPQKITITPPATPVTTVTQQLYHVPNTATKAALLTYLLQDTATFHKVIVFTRTRKVATQIASYLQRKAQGAVGVVHANKGQNTRINTLNAFRNGALRILVATDVMARGIDIAQVSHVINFQVPVMHEEYIHRIGRTGRAKQLGKAITLADKTEEYHIKQIEKLMQYRLPITPLPNDLPVTPTSAEEQKEMARTLDWQRQRTDPTYQGAFHKKKTKSMVRKQRSLRVMRRKHR